MFAKEVYVLPIIVLFRTTWAVRTEVQDLLDLEAQVHDPRQECASATVTKLIKEYEKGDWKIDQATACAAEEIKKTFWKHRDATACAQLPSADVEAWVDDVKAGFCGVKLREYPACVRAAATAASASYARGDLQGSRGELCEETAEAVRHKFSQFLAVSECGTLHDYLDSCRHAAEGEGCERAKSRYSEWVEGVHADFCSAAVTEDDSTCALALAAKLKQSYKRGEWRVTRREVCVKKDEAEAGGMEKSYNRAMADVPQCVLYREFKSSAEVLQCFRGERTGDDCERFKKRALALLLAVHIDFCDED